MEKREPLVAHVSKQPTDQPSSQASSVGGSNPTAIRLAAAVAHRLNNILTVVGGHASFLLETLTDDHPMRQSLEAISDAGDAGSLLTDQLLSVAGQQPLRVQICTVADLMAAARRSAERGAPNGVEVVFSAELGLPDLMVDPARFNEIVDGLTAYGCGLLGSGGRIAIEAGQGPTLGDAVEVRVTATGPEDHAGTPFGAFEPFGARSPQVAKADEIRLAAVWGIVRQSGGSITAEKVPTGITFWMLFPTGG